MPEAVDESRRNFLRLSLAAPVGAVVGAALYPAAEFAGSEIENHTAIATGNGSMQHELDTACATAQDRSACAGDYMAQGQRQTRNIFGAPIIEEMSFRAVPSLMTDLIAPAKTDSHTTPPETILWGNGELRMSRKEIIVGALTSLAFGFSHNISTDSVDTRTLPVQPLIGGGVLWYLQRKLGFLSNFSAHAAYNALWTQGFRTGRSH